MGPTHNSDYLNGGLTGSIVGAIAERDSISPVRIPGGSPPIPFFHNAGLEPNKSVIGTSHSLPLELNLHSGCFEAQVVEPPLSHNTTMPTLEEPAPSDRIHHAEGRDSYPKISLVDESDEKAVSASSRPSAPNLFRRFINWIMDHSAYKNPQLENTNYGWRRKT